MKIGWLGLGKLGVPIVDVLSRHHQVWAYDIDSATSRVPSVHDAVIEADVVFIAVQTPHGPEYEGITRAPERAAPFDLTYLQSAVSSVVEVLDDEPVPIVIVSTVLPGDCREHIYPLLNNQPLVYNPAFIAMGTVESDFLNPEFVLLGSDDNEAMRVVSEVYNSMDIGPVVGTDLETAELVKVAYNTFISQKIVFANTMMEICHKLGRGDVDDVMSILQAATKRLVSPLYMNAGMGDGGPCHPRDNIAMRHLAERLLLSYDPFRAATEAREDQTLWIANLARHEALLEDLPLVLCGRPYKLGVDIETGSCGLLVANLLDKMKTPYTWDDRSQPAVFVACLPMDTDVPTGSVIIDPWGKTHPVEGVEVISVGRN